MKPKGLFFLYFYCCYCTCCVLISYPLVSNVHTCQHRNVLIALDFFDMICKLKQDSFEHARVLLHKFKQTVPILSALLQYASLLALSQYHLSLPSCLLFEGELAIWFTKKKRQTTKATVAMMYIHTYRMNLIWSYYNCTCSIYRVYYVRIDHRYPIVRFTRQDVTKFYLNSIY